LNLTKEVKKIEEVQESRKSQRKKKKKNQKSILIKIIVLIYIVLFIILGISSLIATNKFYKQEIELKNKIIDAQAKTIEIYTKPQTQPVVKEDKADLGQFKLTFYCRM
jgi:flagellar basal body-associated protein FliL